MSETDVSGPRTVIVGGGIAGLAAAAALASRGVPVAVYESRRRFGGRAASWRDPATDELVDFCRHVGMACCTNLADLCRRTGLDRWFRRDRVIYFFGPDGRRYELKASPWLPAPLHLLPSLLRLGYLTWRERRLVCRAVLRLARLRGAALRQTVGDWLRCERQSPRAIERFWAPVLVSALGELLDSASLGYARKVFVDGFLRHRGAYEIDVPILPLGELFDEHLAGWLRSAGATLHAGTTVRRIGQTSGGKLELEFADGGRTEAEQVIVAVAWRRAGELLGDFCKAWPAVEQWRAIECAPISGIHLWFDRPLTELPHAVLVGTLAQWVFNECALRDDDKSPTTEFYHQVVISASYDLATMDAVAAIEQIVGELRRAFPQAAAARLLRYKIVTEREAVFSARPGIDDLRPPQTTPIAGLFLAGDWTATGWPATMEGAVRSGYLAAEAVLARLRRSEKVLVEDLPAGRLARALGMIC